MTRARTIVGALIWIGLLLVAGFYCWRDLTQSQASTVSQLSQYLFVPRRQVELQFPAPQFLYAGDPIFERRGDRFVRVGEIISTGRKSGERAPGDLAEYALAEIYSHASPLRAGDRLTYYPASQSMGWVIMSLLTPDKRQRIESIFAEAYAQHFDAISEEFRPLVQESLQSAAPLIWEQLQNSLREQREQWRTIGERYQVELLEKQINPLLRQTIWPTVVRQFQPIAVEIGQELWARLSLWGFGWRYMYDVSPLPQRDLTRKEFERFVARVAVPVIESNLPRLLDTLRVLLVELAESGEVRDVIANSLQALAEDREVRDLAIALLSDVLLRNERLNDRLLEIWRSPAAERAMRLTNDRLDFAVTHIGAELFGDPFVAITPEFSRVLRYKVLKKDYHWFLLERGDPSAGASPPATEIRVVVGEPSLENPFHIPAERRR